MDEMKKGEQPAVKTANAIKSARPYFSEVDIQAITADVRKILESGNMIIGPYVKEFEDRFARYMGTKYAVGMSSCSSAMEVALRYFNVVGSEVVVPTNTFIATPNSVAFAGGTPVFADLDPKTYNSHLANFRAKRTDRTKGAITVHLGGLPIADIEEMRETYDKEGMFLIEDCSHAHGATINGKKVGSIGHAGCFSLMATKVMTSGLGGMLVTDDPDIYEYVLTTRNSASGRLAQIDHTASDWMMSDIAAVVGMRHLGNLEDFLRVRNAIANMYKGELAGSDNISFNEPPSNVRHSYYKFLTTLTRNAADKKRIVDKAKSIGIELGAIYEVPCHMQPVYQKLGHKAGECPAAEEALKRQIALPMHVRLTKEDTDVVTSFLKKETEGIA